MPFNRVRQILFVTFRCRAPKPLHDLAKKALAVTQSFFPQQRMTKNSRLAPTTNFVCRKLIPPCLLCLFVPDQEHGAAGSRLWSLW
jgi:hypothetical protein